MLPPKYPRTRDTGHAAGNGTGSSAAHTHTHTAVQTALAMLSPTIFDASPVSCGNVFLFPPVGAQHVNMARKLYDTNDGFASVLRECDALMPDLPLSLLEVLYPKDDDILASEEIQRPTYYMPALFSVQYGLYRCCVSDHGMRPNAVVGHSIGEYCAAVAAGVLDLESAMKLVNERARAMEAYMPLPSPGSMWALKATEATARAAILDAGVGDAAGLAAINTPDSIVVSGENKAVEALIEALPKGTRSLQVKATHGDHSRLMEPVAKSLSLAAQELYRQTPPREPTCVWASTVGPDAGLLTAESIKRAEFVTHWSRHATNPVDFPAAMDAALRACPRGDEGGDDAPLQLVELGESMLVRFCKGIPSVAEAMDKGDVVASSVLQRVNGKADARDRLAEDGDGPRLDAKGCEVEDCYLLDYCMLD